MSVELSQEFPQPYLRLFFSIDIAGSTALKSTVKSSSDFVSRDKSAGELDANSIEGTQFWLRAFSQFYRNIFTIQQHAYDTVMRKNFGGNINEILKVSDPPRFWKALGDEAVLYVNIEHPTQALIYMRVFTLFFRRMRDELRKNIPDIDLKACAWLAGFPVNNAELSIPSDEEPPVYKKLSEDDQHSSDRRADKTKDTPTTSWFETHFDSLYQLYEGKSNGRLDFIGPQMDLGFRLAKFATPRKLILSADLTYLLLDASRINTSKELRRKTQASDDAVQEENEEGDAYTSPTQTPSLFSYDTADATGVLNLGKYLKYDGLKELKGVLNGRRYPVFWYSAFDDPFGLAEEALRGDKPLSLPDAKNACKVFLTKFNSSPVADTLQSLSVDSEETASAETEQFAASAAYWLHLPYIKSKLPGFEDQEYGVPTDFHKQELSKLKMRWNEYISKKTKQNDDDPGDDPPTAFMTLSPERGN